MNIMKKLTLRGLKLNKKRTIVTIIGIMLSVALICAVAGMVTSFQATLIDYAIKDGGNRHLTVENVSKEDLKYFTNNSHVKSIYLTTNIGYAKYDNLNKDKPYIYVMGYNKEAFLNTTINVEAGRLPIYEGEIIISVPFHNNAKVNIGDIIKLNVGKRICSDGSILNQNNPYYVEEGLTHDCHEYLTDTKYYEYKVVGIMQRPDYSLEAFSAPGYTAITYVNDIKDNINVSLLFKDAKYYKEYTSLINSDKDLSKYNISYNNDLLRWSGASLSDKSLSMLMYIAGVVIGIIIFTSVFVIKNSFDISNQEKRRMYGMLSSIGATKSQIKKCVLYEGFILGLIGIPLGILCGILADYILVILINLLGSYMFDGIAFLFKISLLPIVISILLGSLTIYLSVIKSARKSSKISAIEAIRNNNEIKISEKKVKSSWLVNKLFGVGGDIAYKNLKRNKKRNRTTVISIVLSVAVFISLSSFINYGFKITNQYYTDLSYSIQVYIRDDNKDISNLYNDIIKFDNVSNYSLQRHINMQFDNSLYLSREAIKYSGSDEKRLDIISVGNREFERLLKENNINLDNYNFKALLLDTMVYYSDNKYIMYNVLDLSKSNTISCSLNGKNISINLVKRVDKVPMGLENTYSDSPKLIVSDEFYQYIMDNFEVDYVDKGALYLKSDNAEKLESQINEYLLTKEVVNYNVYNVDSEAKAQRGMIILISIFLYGFITVISLIGITNIINTINTNMDLRRRELAMLKSIGMTKKEFNKMINLESIMYCSKALVIGIPLGLLGSYGIYKAFAKGNDYGYVFLYKPIIISILVVYLLVSIIMYFALRKMRNENIIDVIKDENI